MDDEKKKKVVRVGTGEPKKWESGSGKSTTISDTQKLYRKNAEGKLEEYTGKPYVDDKKAAPMKSNPHEKATKEIEKSNPRFMRD